MVHTFRQNGYNVALDSVSGSVHCVDDVAFDVINAYENTSRDEIIRTVSSKHNVSEQDVIECLEDVDGLKAEGLLFAEDTFRPDVEKLAKRDYKSALSARCSYL